MIFISQSGLTVHDRHAQWDAWYVEHLRIMQTVTGITSACRCTTQNKLWPPSLAMYSISSPAVFQDPYYQKIRGMGEWLPRIDQRFYIRNLFEGLEFAPEVPAGSVLLVTDQPTPRLDLPGIEFTWLKSVGLDCSTPYRGIAVRATWPSASSLRDVNVAIYKPC